MGADRLQPGKARCPKPGPAIQEKRPFESWQQIEAVAERLGPVYGPMMVFAAATGLRPSELFALEQRDIDRGLGVVYVRRAFANARLKQTKTRLSTRAVPLQAIALEALDRLPASENPILFPNSRGGHIDFRSFGRRHWKPAQVAAGIEPLRQNGRQFGQQKELISRNFAKPSDGLEPSTPSLPWNFSRNRSQPTATVFACLGRLRGCAVCQPLPRVATAGLHKGSTFGCLCWLRRPPLTSASAGAFAKATLAPKERALE